MATKKQPKQELVTEAAMYHTGTPVVEFHEVFGHPVETKPTVPDIETRLLRVKLIAEELKELAEASGVLLAIVHGNIHVEPMARDICDLVEVADALTDLRYVIDGANIVYGIPGEACLQEVHASNMSKLGEDGKPILREDGKILKGPNFVEPDLRAVLSLHGME